MAYTYMAKKRNKEEGKLLQLIKSEKSFKMNRRKL